MSQIFPRTYSPSYKLKAAYYRFVLSAYDVGGYDVSYIGGMDIFGLDWVRTVELHHRRDQVAYRMVNPEDFDVMFPHWDDTYTKMYGGMPQL